MLYLSSSIRRTVPTAKPPPRSWSRAGSPVDTSSCPFRTDGRVPAMDTSREQPLSTPLALGPLRWKLVTLFVLAAATIDPVLRVPVPQVPVVQGTRRTEGWMDRARFPSKCEAGRGFSLGLRRCQMDRRPRVAVGIPHCSGSRPAEQPLPGLSKSKTRKAEGWPAHRHPPHEHLDATSPMLVPDALRHQCQPVGTAHL